MELDEQRQFEAICAGTAMGGWIAIVLFLLVTQ